jgi:hypothetical protein
MDTILKKIEQAKERSYRGEPVGVPVSIRIPPLLLEGAIAHMNENGLTSLSASIVDILEEGIITIGTK